MYESVYEVVKPIAIKNKGVYDFAIIPVKDYIVLKVFQKYWLKCRYEIHHEGEIEKVIEEIRLSLSL